MPKSLKMKGSICNIPVTEIDVNCNTLPRPVDSNGLLIVKLKPKLKNKNHVIFEKALVVQFLEFLKLHNHLYSDIEINYNSIPVNMLVSHKEKLEKSEIYLQLLRTLALQVNILIKDYCIIVKSLLQIVTIYSLHIQYYRKFNIVVR